jgi:ABC-type sugar transport system ATPase subunit
MMATAGKLVRIRGLRKTYGNTRALDGIDLDLRSGEVLGIAGPNGAGKSTLMRILAGEEWADSGEIWIDDTPWTEASADAVAVVHQEPQLFPNLTVSENLMVGREGTGFCNPRLGENERDLISALGLSVVASRTLGSCTLATQQRTEIAKALARQSTIFLFDEPNSALTPEDSYELFAEIHRLADEGRVVILVTHRLGDLVQHANRVAIVRDGRITTILDGEHLTEDAIAQQLVLGAGFEREADVHKRLRGAGQVATSFSVGGWSQSDGAFSNVAMSIERGKIVGLLGVEGSGARELLRSFAGLEECDGSIEIEGAEGSEAIRRFTAYVPATRQESLYTNLSVGENLVIRLGQPEIADAGFFLMVRRMRRFAKEAVKRFLVKTETTTQPIRSLSGGNQQKVAIAQALVRRPRLLALEEPTRGVDIGSKAEIYRILREFAQAGNVVVMFCTETLEVFEAVDRLHVVSDGNLSQPLFIDHYEEVEALAGDIALLERHNRAQVRR